MPNTRTPGFNKFISNFFGKEGGSASLAQRVGNNERKITALKNIILAPKSIGDGFRSLGTSPGGGIGEVISDIREAVGGILITLTTSEKFEKKVDKKERIKTEQDKRDKKEEDLETKRWQGIKEGAGKVLEPVKSLWEKVFGFIQTLFFGRIAIKIFDWFADKKNGQKIQSLLNFMKTWWPALTAAVLLFGTSFGTMVAGLGKVLVLGIPKLLKVMKALFLITKTNPLKAAAAAGILGLGTLGLSKLGSEKRKEEESGFSEGGLVTPPVQQFVEGGLVTPPVQKLAEGGFVSGPSGVDKVPARLTAGEFVMSKGAVDKFGMEFMEGINSAGGGTNRPTGGRYNVGGKVEKGAVQKLVEGERPVITSDMTIEQQMVVQKKQKLWDRHKQATGASKERDKESSPIPLTVIPYKDDKKNGPPLTTEKTSTIDWLALSQLTKDMPDPVTPTIGQGNVEEAKELRNNFAKRIQLAEKKTDLLIEKGFNVNAPTNLSSTEVVNNLLPQGGQGDKEMDTPNAPEIPDFGVGIFRSPTKIKTLGIFAL